MSEVEDPQAPKTRTHRFRREALLADGARAVFGLLITLGPLIMLDTAVVVTWVCVVLALLFAWFGGRTLIRLKSRVVVTPEGIDLVGPRRRSIRWRDLEEVHLAYFAPRRAQPGHGWMQLTLRERPDSTLRLDSTLERFDELLADVHRMALAAGLPLDPTTSSNLAALGLAPAGAGIEDGDTPANAG